MTEISVKSLQNILKPICEMLVSKYADSCDFEAVMCILQNIDNKNPIWYHSSNIQNMKHQKIHEQATILHWAATYGQLSVIQYVCRFVKEKNPYDIWGVTPLHLAAENGHLEIVKFLMEYLHDEKNPKSYIEFSGLGLRTHLESYGCVSVLDMASRSGNLDVFKYLLNFSSHKSLRANSGFTPMHWAAMYGKLNILEYLLDHVENINPGNAQKMTPMHLASKNGHTEVVTFLRDFSTDSNPENRTGITPLHLAAQYGYLDIVKSLMLIILDPDSKNPGSNDGTTPLHLAARNNHESVVIYML